MTRQIKFRGKNKGLWIYGSLVLHHTYDFDAIIRGGTSFDIEDSATIGQFTGLFDKNGNEIYEGDILEDTFFNDSEYQSVMEVVYDGPGYCLKMLKGNEKSMETNDLFSFPHFDGNRLRKGAIIGNIHDK